MNNDPFQRNVYFCPTCDCERAPEQIFFVEAIEELGGVLRFRCNVCENCFELLPPGVPLPRTPEEHNQNDGLP